MRVGISLSARHKSFEWFNKLASKNLCKFVIEQDSVLLFSASICNCLCPIIEGNWVKYVTLEVNNFPLVQSEHFCLGSEKTIIIVAILVYIFGDCLFVSESYLYGPP